MVFVILCVTLLYHSSEYDISISLGSLSAVHAVIDNYNSAIVFNYFYASVFISQQSSVEL